MRLDDLIKAAETERRERVKAKQSNPTAPQQQSLFNTRKYQYPITR